jgi:hypothetical protein
LRARLATQGSASAAGRTTMKSVGTAVILALLLIAPLAFAASCPIARGPCSITVEF